MKNSISAICLTLLCITLVVLVAVFGVTSLNIGGVFEENSVSLGLDLVGGSSITYAAKPEDGKTPSQSDMDKSMEIIRRRLDEMNYNEAVVSGMGGDRVRVEIPGINDPEEASRTLGSPAQLTFLEFGGASIDEAIYDPYNMSEDANHPLLMDGKVVIEGKDVTDAKASYGQLEGSMLSQWYVELTLNNKAQKAFTEATERVKNYGENRNFIAIVLDGEAVSYPTVSITIDSNKCTITGNMDEKEARELATLISLGQMPVTFEAIEVRAVSATQGEGALETSLKAGLIGIILVMIFMIIFYRVPGVVSCIALVAYTAIFGVVLVLTKVNLSLAGIAGIILTIGMAVDSNVIIYERIKEELRDGKTLRSAVKSGFSRAFAAIFDANITTIIAAVVLWAFGKGTVEGFAKTLLIGVIISLFTALVVTRVLLKALVELKINPVLFGSRKNKED